MASGAIGLASTAVDFREREGISRHQLGDQRPALGRRGSGVGVLRN
jgi:hypothetical protein